MIVFYIPYKIDPDRPSTPNIRPLKLKAELEKIGEVIFIEGTLLQRMRLTVSCLIGNLRNTQSKDKRLYFESASTPLLLSNIKRNCGFGFIDYFLIALLGKITHIRMSFIRDVHWNFGTIHNERSEFLKLIYKVSGYIDSFLIQKLSDIVFLPSIEMKDHLGVSLTRRIYDELPPGLDSGVLSRSLKTENTINLLYVGGVGEVYDLRPLIVLKQYSDIRIIICTRKSDLKSRGEYLLKHVDSQLKIVHASDDDLERYYEWADFGCLLFRPIEYHNFQVPFKLYEYAARGLPILASAPSKFASVVKENNIGVIFEDNHLELHQLLRNIKDNRIDSYVRNLGSFVKQSTWASRANKIATCEYLTNRG